MVDVAAHAGVSMQTVSRVANASPKVDPGTRERVLESMRALGYRQNATARALRLGEYRNIGVIMFSVATFGNLHTLEAISNQAATAGYSVTLVTALTPTQEGVSEAFARVGGQLVDGFLIVIDQQYLVDGEVKLPTGLPVVVIDSARRSDYPVVDTDQRQGAGLATRHLLDLGHRTVHHVAGPPDAFAAQSRESAWRDTLEAAGAVVHEPLRGDWSTESGYQKGLELATRDDVSAVFAGNDQMALGVIRAFHESGVAVPERISVVGFDDMPGSDAFWPPLTTVHQHFDQVGGLAIETLLAEIRGEDVDHRRMAVPTELIVRKSSGPPRLA